MRQQQRLGNGWRTSVAIEPRYTIPRPWKTKSTVANTCARGVGPWSCVRKQASTRVRAFMDGFTFRRGERAEVDQDGPRAAGARKGRPELGAVASRVLRTRRAAFARLPDIAALPPASPPVTPNKSAYFFWSGIVNLSVSAHCICAKAGRIKYWIDGDAVRLAMLPRVVSLPKGPHYGPQPPNGVALLRARRGLPHAAHPAAAALHLLVCAAHGALGSQGRQPRRDVHTDHGAV